MKSLTLVSRATDGSERSLEVFLPPEFSQAFQVDAQLGRGAMGAVFSGRQVSTGRAVAIKVLLTPEEPEALARFQREGQILARLSHPAILRVYDSGSLAGHPYLVTALLPGGNLRKRLKTGGAFGLAEAAAIAAKLADGLAACHAAGVVHRDLKPENVMFDERDYPVIVDLGIARLAQAGRLTLPGATMGTPVYMAPEQWADGSVDAAADVYALGVMVYEMLVGRPPFVASSILELLNSHVHEVPPRLEERSGTPKELADLVARALAKDPRARPTAMDMACTLASVASAALAVDTAPVRPQLKTPSRGGLEQAARGAWPSRGRALALAFAAPVTLAVAFALFRAPRERPVPPVASAVPASAATPAPELEALSRAGILTDRERQLSPGAVARIGPSWLTHPSLSNVVLSRDGRTLATLDARSTVRLWDLSTHALRGQWTARCEVSQLAFVDGDRSLALLHRGRDDAMVSVVDPVSGERTRLQGAREPGQMGRLSGRFALWKRRQAGAWLVSVVDLDSGARTDRALALDHIALAVSADGRTLVARQTASVAVMDVPSGKITGQFAATPVDDPDSEVDRELAVSRDGRVAALPMGAVVQLVQLPEGRPLRTLEVPALRQPEFSPDGRWLAGVSSSTRRTAHDAVARIIDVATGAARVLDGQPGPVSFAADGAWLAVAGCYGVPQVRDPRTLASVPDLPRGTEIVAAITANRVYLDGPDGHRSVDLADGRVVDLRPAPVGFSQHAAYSANGRGLMILSQIAGEPGLVLSLFDAITGVRRAHAPVSGRGGVFISADGSRAALVELDAVIFVAPGGATPVDLPFHSGRDLAFDPTFTWAAACTPQMPRFVRVDQLQRALKDDLDIARAGAVRTVLAFSSDGRRVILEPGARGGALVLDVPSLRALATLESIGDRQLRRLSFSPDGSLLAGTLSDDSLQVWHPDGAVSHRFPGRPDRALQVAVDPSADRLVTLNEDRSVTVYRLSAGRLRP